MKRVLLIGFLIIAAFGSTLRAQPQISYITPDAGAPGMCVAVEIIAPDTAVGTFGNAGIYGFADYDIFSNEYTDSILVHLVRPSDSALVRFGPSIVSWNGRAIQQMFMLEPNTKVRDTEIYFDVVVKGVASAVDSFEIRSPYDLGTLSGGGPIIGPRTKRNTLVVDSLILENGTYTVPPLDPDGATPGNQAYLPFRLLSAGPIRLINATINANGAAGVTGTGGGNGGPGGGGGGAGYPGSGGNGYTGGGGEGNGGGHGGTGTGSAAGTNSYDGDSSLNGVAGGAGDAGNNGADEGGGGGTGLPFGKSGQSGRGNSVSGVGGYGGGSGGGDAGSGVGAASYAGGGGGNLNAGAGGQGGSVNNGGQANGNAMLVPLFGGSGGGSGNVEHFSGGVDGGSGGGGGGAVELTSFAAFTATSSSLQAIGGSGSNGATGLLQSAAGGGGGAGGAISISARDSVVFSSNSNTMVGGGQGGSGSDNGGNGSMGRIRISGYVSKSASPNSNFYFLDTNGFTCPSIQKVTSTPSTVLVRWYAAIWDGTPIAPGTVYLYYSWPSTHHWFVTEAVYPTLNSQSHTAEWDFSFPNSAKPEDSQVYLVAVQGANAASTPYTAVPPGVMSHTSGIIAKVVRPATIGLSFATINFGNILVDSCSRDTTLEIRSTGAGALIVDSIVWSPPLPDYSDIVSPALPDTIPVGGSLAVTLKFCPSTGRCPIASSLRIYSNAINSPDTMVAATGCGIGPHALLTPLVIDFGRVHLGDCKDTFATIIDTGSSPLTITRESLGDPVHFKILDPLPITVAAGDSVHLHLEFCPSDTTTITTSDSIVSDAPESPNVLTLLGSGKGGILSLPPVLDFGLVHLDSCKDSGFYAQNTGNDSLVVTSQSITGSGNFTILSPSVPFVIPADSSVFVRIQFCATDTGAFSATATEGTDVPDSGSVLLLAHSGLGILSIPDTIDFGTVPSGSCVDTSIFVENVGTDTLFLQASANLIPPFYYLGPEPLVLAPGQGDSLPFRFCSTDTAGHSETTSFDTLRHGISPFFTLLGKGSQGALATSGPVDLGCMKLGTDTTVTMTIRNIGSGAIDGLTVTLIPAGIASIVHAPPGTLPAGASDYITLVVPASSLGPLSGSINITWSNGSLPTIPIAGNVSYPTMNVLTHTVSFDSTLLGDSSTTICVQLENGSCVPFTLDSVFLRGNISGSFEVVSEPSGPITDSSISTICLRFRPRALGPDSSNLLVIGARDTVSIPISGVGIGNAVGVQLAIDTVAGRPGEIVNVPVRTLNDITSAAITSLTFRVTFDPMQLDMRSPVKPITLGIEPIRPLSTTATYSVKTYSIGDKEITATYSSPLTGTPDVADLPFEILEPTANTASIHLVSASFGTSPASLSSTLDGEVQIEQCDTSGRVALSVAPMIVSQNTPNPFSARTTININVQLAGHLTVELYNALGMKVMVPFDGDVGTGMQTIPIDAARLPSGAYRYITTWTGTGSTAYAPESARDEKTMIVLGQ